MVGTALSHVIEWSKSATSTDAVKYMGNDARFLHNVGASDVGHLIVDMTVRVNTASAHNVAAHLLSSQDVKGNHGAI